jgi:hypothetical protein
LKVDTAHMQAFAPDSAARITNCWNPIRRSFGPPGIIFFDAHGRGIKGLRVIGYQDAERFLKTLSRAAAP